MKAAEGLVPSAPSSRLELTPAPRVAGLQLARAAMAGLHLARAAMAEARARPAPVMEMPLSSPCASAPQRRNNGISLGRHPALLRSCLLVTLARVAS